MVTIHPSVSMVGMTTLLRLYGSAFGVRQRVQAVKIGLASFACQGSKLKLPVSVRDRGPSRDFEGRRIRPLREEPACFAGGAACRGCPVR